MAVSYEQFQFVRFAFPAYKNVTSDVKGSEPIDRVIVAAEESKKVEAARRLRCQQEFSSLMRELMSRFSQPGDLVLDPFARICPTAVACVTVPCHPVLVGCEASVCQK